ncbi:hypothetical protein [Crocosphaera sp.]|uniref:hypothetical protein n=1 Tax=Crocosphaera sp. TaxID=2729996 RepID=UPI002605B425|nr:hypothetical protein [Crocosphaera sp.]MDJ0579646.1 hypothetical protein [Crocosphaera sp.]
MRIVKTFSGNELYRLAIAQGKFEIEKRGLGITAKIDSSLTLPQINPEGVLQYTNFEIITSLNDKILIGFEPSLLHSLADFQSLLVRHLGALTITLGLPQDVVLNKVYVEYEVPGSILSYFSENILPLHLSKCFLRTTHATRINNGEWILPKYFDKNIVKEAHFKVYGGDIIACVINDRKITLDQNIANTEGQMILNISPSVKYEGVEEEFLLQSLPSILVRRMSPDNMRQSLSISQIRDQPYEIIIISEEEKISEAIAEQLVVYMKENSTVHLPLYDLEFDLDVTSLLSIVRSDRFIKGSLPQVKFQVTARNISLT